MKLCPSCEEAYPDDAGYCPFDGEALVRNVDPLLGRTMAARYRLVRRLGSGGMAVVYLARHVMIERRNAIKILRQDLGMNPAHRERFLREARAVNRINHPNIVEITDFGEDGGLVFLVMEYVEGASLASIVHHNALPWKRAARIGLQVASALGRAHELGVIHRDLKPENVLLCIRNGEDVVKLTDFGIAKIVDAPALTFSEQRFGTPGYMAPEYIEGAPTSAQGDLYAFGVVLYELMTASLPFDARFPAEFFALQMNEAPVKPSTRVPGIPPELEALILRMISRRPEDRPRDAFAVHDALADVLARSGGHASRRAPASSGVAAPGATLEMPAASTAVPRSSVASEIPARWQTSIDQFEAQLDEARLVRGDAEPRVRRAADLVEALRKLLVSLERAAGAVSEHQTAVDGLEADGRVFRATLGHAIDTLSHDRSRLRTRLDGSRPSEEPHPQAIDQDLGYQIDMLERQLNERNERLDGALAEATAKLEGALSAVRRITREMSRTRRRGRACVEGRENVSIAAAASPAVVALSA